MFNFLFKGLFDSDMTTVIGVDAFLLCMHSSYLAAIWNSMFKARRNIG